MLLVFPAMISLDLRRRSAARADLLCCLMPESPLPKKKVAERSKTRKNDKVIITIKTICVLVNLFETDVTSF